MERSISLLVDLYELTMSECYFRYKKDNLASFDLFVRQLPENRSYLIAAGLEDTLNYIRNLNFNKEDLAYLKEQKIFSSDFLGFLADLKFSGDIWAMPEGEVFFANEPVIRVTAPIIQAQIIESFLLNTINLQTMIASKASRIACVSKDMAVYDFALRRTHGQDAAMKVARSSYIAGFAGTSNVLAGKIYKIPIVGTMAHSFVMSFKKELDSFFAYSATFPARTILLVDTYDAKNGIQNAIRIGLALKKRGFRLLGIRIDSGNIVNLSKLARKMLDDAGLRYVNIFASGNLDEFKIRDILNAGGCCDSFGVGTHMGTSIDAPALDVIYKLSEVSSENGRFLPTMKLSKGKITYPGRKQVFRVEDKRGNFIYDILGLEGEKIKAKPLLQKVMDKARLVYEPPSLEKIREYVRTNLEKFPLLMKDVSGEYRYPVLLSPKLKRLIQKLSHKKK